MKLVVLHALQGQSSRILVVSSVSSPSGNQYYMKYIESLNDKLLAVCDEDILNEKLESRGVLIVAKSSFYGSVLHSEEDVIEAFKKANNVNLIGNNAVNLAIRFGLVKEQAILWLNRVDKKKSAEPVAHAMFISG